MGIRGRASDNVMNDLLWYEASFPGPPNSPYEAGTFLLSIRFHPGHPYMPPRIRFITKLYHCNVSSDTGALSIDMLADQWSPALTIGKVIMGIMSLLPHPNPGVPFEPEIARL